MTQAEASPVLQARSDRRFGFPSLPWESYLLLAGLAVAWELAARAGLAPGFALSPSRIGAEYVRQLLAGDLAVHAAVSLYRVAAGFCLGALVGIVLGIISGVSRAAESFFEAFVSLTSSVPKVVLLPLVMVWFGVGDFAKIVIIMMAIFYPLFINSYYGAKSVPISLLWIARSMGASPLTILRRVILPGAMPSILAGLQIGLARSFILIFAAEMISSTDGLGFLIQFAERYSRYDLMYVSIITIGVLGLLADRLLVLIRSRVLHYLDGAGEAPE